MCSKRSKDLKVIALLRHATSSILTALLRHRGNRFTSDFEVAIWLIAPVCIKVAPPREACLKSSPTPHSHKPHSICRSFSIPVAHGTKAARPRRCSVRCSPPCAALWQAVPAAAKAPRSPPQRRAPLPRHRSPSPRARTWAASPLPGPRVGGHVMRASSLTSSAVMRPAATGSPPESMPAPAPQQPHPSVFKHEGQHFLPLAWLSPPFHNCASPLNPAPTLCPLQATSRLPSLRGCAGSAPWLGPACLRAAPSGSSPSRGSCSRCWWTTASVRWEALWRGGAVLAGARQLGLSLASRGARCLVAAWLAGRGRRGGELPCPRCQPATCASASWSGLWRRTSFALSRRSAPTLASRSWLRVGGGQRLPAPPSAGGACCPPRAPCLCCRGAPRFAALKPMCRGDAAGAKAAVEGREASYVDMDPPGQRG